MQRRERKMRRGGGGELDAELGGAAEKLAEKVEDLQRRVEALEKMLAQIRREAPVWRTIEELHGYSLVETGDPLRPYALISPDGAVNYYLNRSYAEKKMRELAGV